MSHEDSPHTSEGGYATMPLAANPGVDPPNSTADNADADAPLALTQTPFAGAIAFADLVAETQSEVGGILAGVAYIAQAAVEEQIPSIAAEIKEVLGPSLSEAGRDDCDITVDELRSGNLPLTAEAIGAQIRAAFGETVTAFADPNRLTDAAIEAFLDSELASAHDGHARFEKVKEDVDKIIADTKRKPRWVACSSLELPSVLDNHAPIYCTRVKGARHLDALEYTSERQEYNAFAGNITQTGPVGSTADYINDPRSAVYRSEIPSIGTSFSYAVHPIDAPKNALKSAIGQFVAKWKKGHQVEIQKIVNRHKEAAQQLVSKALTAAQISADFAGPVVAALAFAIEKVVNFILDRIAHAWGDVILTPWTIVHTAIMGTACVPISIFTLSTPSRGNTGLCRLDTRAPDLDQGSSRFLIGPSALPTPTHFHPRYFDWAAESGQPHAWQEPLESHTGFRVLVPHLDRELVLDRAGRKLLRKGKDKPYKELAAASKRLYVSALRTDVLCLSRPAIPKAPKPGWSPITAAQTPKSSDKGDSAQ